MRRKQRKPTHAERLKWQPVRAGLTATEYNESRLQGRVIVASNGVFVLRQPPTEDFGVKGAEGQQPALYQVEHTEYVDPEDGELYVRMSKVPSPDEVRLPPVKVTVKVDKP